VHREGVEVLAEVRLDGVRLLEERVVAAAMPPKTTRALGSAARTAALPALSSATYACASGPLGQKFSVSSSFQIS
jgi:hypothetical protein